MARIRSKELSSTYSPPLPKFKSVAYSTVPLWWDGGRQLFPREIFPAWKLGEKKRCLSLIRQSINYFLPPSPFVLPWFRCSLFSLESALRCFVHVQFSLPGTEDPGVLEPGWGLEVWSLSWGWKGGDAEFSSITGVTLKAFKYLVISVLMTGPWLIEFYIYHLI